MSGSQKKPDQKDASNEEILSEIRKLEDKISELRKSLRPVVADKRATLAEANSSLLDERKAKFNKREEEKKRIAEALKILDAKK